MFVQCPESIAAQGELLGGSFHLVGCNPSFLSGLTLLIPLYNQGYDLLSK